MLICCSSTVETLFSKARHTLFADNSEIGAKLRKNNVWRIVYKRHSPCFANRFFVVCCMQDLRRGNGLVDKHKVFFHWKKLSAVRKLTANNEQCTATRSSRFRQQYFIWWKNNFVPYSSCLHIVYRGLQACIVALPLALYGNHMTDNAHTKEL